MGGMQGFGHVQELTSPAVCRALGGKAFALAALAARVAGTNLDAFRYAIESRLAGEST